MMLLRVLLSIVIISVAGLTATEGSLLGSRKCTYGPSYWCGSLGKAKECSAVSQCIQAWHGLSLPADKDGICTLCMEMIEDAEDFIASNNTEASIEDLFDTTCRLIPLASIEETCLQIGAEYIPEVLQLLASEMQPQEVCAAVGLCNSVDVDRQLRENQLTEWKKPQTKALVRYEDPDPQDCNDCQSFLGDMVQLTTKYGKDELLSHLMSICGELGALGDGCIALVQVNIDMIYDFIVNDMDVKQVCELFDMCEDVKYRMKTLRANSGEQGCDFCVMAADYIRQQLVANNTEQHYKAVLESLCGQTGGFANECQALVDTYYESSYNWLVNEFDAVKLCELIGFCGSIDSTKPVWSTLDTTRGDLGKTLPIKIGSFVGDDEANAIQVSVVGESGLQVADDNTCMLCKFTLHFAQQELNDQSTREEIEQFVKGVCVYFPETLQEECNDYVDAYGDQVIALLEQEIDPSVVCPELHLCPSVAHVPHHLRDVPCVMCEYAMMNFKQLLGDRTNEQAVEDALDELCKVMPHSLAGQCQTFVDQNAVEIMKLMADGIQPEQMCTSLGLCDGQGMPRPISELAASANQLPPLFTGDELGAFSNDLDVNSEDQPIEKLAELTPAHQLPLSRMFPGYNGGAVSLSSQDVLLAHKEELENSLSQGRGCVMCEFVIKTLEHLVLDKNTGIEEDMKSAVDQVCVLMPMSLADDCLTFVERYGDQIVKVLVNAVNPHQICTELMLCDAKTVIGMERLALPVALPLVRARRSAPAPHADTCLVCKALDNSPEDVVCGHAVEDLEGFTMQHCDELTANPDACTNHCPSRPNGLLGSKKCTWGPAFWCSKHINAHSCGGAETVSYCVERKQGFAAAP